MRKLISFLLLVLVNSANAQNTNWSFLSNANIVYDVIDFGDSLLCNANAGVLVADKATQEFRMMDTPADKLYSRGICFDASGNIWISNYGSGIYSYNSNSWTFYNSANSSLPSNYISTIHFLDNKIWAATGSGLSSFDGTIWQTFTSANSGIPSDYINDMAMGSDSILWVATQNGLGKYSNATWTVYDTLNTPFTVQNISALDVDNNNHVWVATLDDNAAGSFAAAIYMFDGINWNTFPSAIYPGDQINVIHCGKNNQVFFASRTSSANGWFSLGLSLFDGSIWQRFDNLNSGFTNYEVNSICSDSAGKVFIGTKGNYIFTFSNGVFQEHEIKNCDVPSNIVYAIAVSGEKKYTSSKSSLVQWDQEFLSYFDGQQWFQLDTIDASCNFIEFVNDSIAYAGYGSQLHKLQGLSDSILVTPPSLGTFKDLAIDVAGNFWFATTNGVAKYSAGNWTIYNTSNSGIPDDYVGNIVSSGNNIWVSTLSGLGFFDNSIWTVYDTTNSSLLPGYIFQMCIVDSSIYLGPFSQNVWPIQYLGIQKIELINNIPANWSLIDTSNSDLLSNNVTVIKSNGNQIWIGTQEGVSRLDTTLNFTTYNSPLLNNNIHDITFSADGKKYFANDRYVSIVQSDSLVNEIYTPRLSTLMLYPNPATNIVNVKCTSEIKKRLVTIFTIEGVFVKEEAIENNSVINTKSLKPGLYIFHVSFEDGTTIRNSIITII